LNIRKIGPKGGGLRVRHRLLTYTAIALVAAWWFYSKLQWDQIHIPLDGNIHLGWLYIPFFAFVIVATQHSVNITDGLDGLCAYVNIFTALMILILSRKFYNILYFSTEMFF
jgi:phospho-N-acetylmuramoyl-pentapeptide-transferase